MRGGGKTHAMDLDPVLGKNYMTLWFGCTCCERGLARMGYAGYSLEVMNSWTNVTNTEGYVLEHDRVLHIWLLAYIWKSPRTVAILNLEIITSLLDIYAQEVYRI